MNNAETEENAVVDHSIGVSGVVDQSTSASGVVDQSTIIATNEIVERQEMQIINLTTMLDEKTALLQELQYSLQRREEELSDKEVEMSRALDGLQVVQRECEDLRERNESLSVPVPVSLLSSTPSMYRRDGEINLEEKMAEEIAEGGTEEGTERGREGVRAGEGEVGGDGEEEFTVRNEGEGQGEGEGGRETVEMLSHEGEWVRVRENDASNTVNNNHHHVIIQSDTSDYDSGNNGNHDSSNNNNNNNNSSDRNRNNGSSSNLNSNSHSSNSRNTHSSSSSSSADVGYDRDDKSVAAIDNLNQQLIGEFVDHLLLDFTRAMNNYDSYDAILAQCNSSVIMLVVVLNG